MSGHMKLVTKPDLKSLATLNECSVEAAILHKDNENYLIVFYRPADGIYGTAWWRPGDTHWLWGHYDCKTYEAALYDALLRTQRNLTVGQSLDE